MNIGLARNGRNCGGAHDESGRATILARFVVCAALGLIVRVAAAQDPAQVLFRDQIRARILFRIKFRMCRS